MNLFSRCNVGCKRLLGSLYYSSACRRGHWDLCCRITTVTTERKSVAIEPRDCAEQLGFAQGRESSLLYYPSRRITGVEDVYYIDRSSIERKYRILWFAVLGTNQIRAIINPYTVLILLYFVPGYWLVFLRLRVIGGKIVPVLYACLSRDSSPPLEVSVAGSSWRYSNLSLTLSHYSFFAVLWL
jgi:hypothetical protein